jgi:hypothetical protein
MHAVYMGTVRVLDVCKPSNITDFTQATSAALSAAVRAEAERNAATASANDEESTSPDEGTDDDEEETNSDKQDL